jgi:homoserine acetyltransferase
MDNKAIEIATEAVNCRLAGTFLQTSPEKQIKLTAKRIESYAEDKAKNIVRYVDNNELLVLKFAFNFIMKTDHEKGVEAMIARLQEIWLWLQPIDQKWFYDKVEAEMKKPYYNRHWNSINILYKRFRKRNPEKTVNIDLQSLEFNLAAMMQKQQNN